MPDSPADFWIAGKFRRGAIRTRQNQVGVTVNFMDSSN